MLRRQCKSILHPAKAIPGAAPRMLSATSVALQLQHFDRFIGRTHGAGLVKHDSMATTDLSHLQRIPRGVTQAPPAADLHRTPVHEGLGTSAEDPYSRTLPNQESRPPETTVLSGARVTAPTVDEVSVLGKKWATMQYWLGDTHPRLPVYLRSLMVRDALPVSAHAEALTADFPHQLSTILHDSSEATRSQVAALWSKALDEYGAVSAMHLFDRGAFESSLSALHAETTAAVQSVSANEGVLLAFEVLRRKAVLKRNSFLEDGLVRLVEGGPYLGFGDGIWRVFFSAVESCKERVFGEDASRMLGFAWEAVVREDAARTPAVTGIVALFFTLSSIVQSHFAVAEESLKKASYRLDEGLTRSPAEPITGTAQDTLRVELLQLVNPIVKRTFAMEKLRELLETVEGAASLSKALRAAGLHELSREAALCEAMSDHARLLQADTAPLIDRFDSTQEVKSLLASIVAGTDAKARRHVLQTFGHAVSASSSGVDWERVFLAVDWDSNWRQLTASLLGDSDTLNTIGKLVRAAIGAKGSVRRLFSQEYADALKEVSDARALRATLRKRKILFIVGELSSFSHVDTAVQILKDLGVPVDPLLKEAAAVGEAQKRNRPVVEAKVLEVVLAEVARRHPSWQKAGVLPAALSLPSTAGQLNEEGVLQLLQLMARVYIRLTYVPQAGAASLAQHTRRRIGPVATEPYQFNVPAEVGFVEQYDNLQYKRYDWQGWYQRMTDVHNRNVSIRCRIDDLKRLDGFGSPFVDLQTERRMRILAGDRIGMGVMKLDSDKFEDQSDNITHGTGKLSEILAESRKAQLGPEYWPTVEVKVRRPSGQSQAFYSTIDFERIEQRSRELYEKYRDAKKRSLFVTPMDLWLEVKGMQVRKSADTADAEGYTLDSLQKSLDDE